MTVTTRLPFPISAHAQGQERILAQICLERPERSTVQHDVGQLEDGTWSLWKR